MDKSTKDPLTFLESRLVPFPADAPVGTVAVTDPAIGRVAVYDSALTVLVFLRNDRRVAASKILLGLAALQNEDGSLPFSFSLAAPPKKEPGETEYVRAGAVAWVGYAAAEYLDAEDGGPDREPILALATRAAAYLVGRRVNGPGSAKDKRESFVRGGSGDLRYRERAGAIEEDLVPSDITWTSVEHNIDTYFFLRALVRVTGRGDLKRAADEIAHALLDRAWDGDAGQFVRGVVATDTDDVHALDCASWGSVFLRARGDKVRGDTAFAVADARYAAFDASSGARGHRPYAAAKLIEDNVLLEHYAPKLPAKSWDDLEAVWPEGSAGVAFAALRDGRPSRARAILDALEPLRAADGSVPTLTVEIPYEFDRAPSIAGTAWIELVRFELGRPPNKPTLWAP